MHTTQTRAYTFQKRPKKRECQQKKQRARKKHRNRQRNGRCLYCRLSIVKHQASSITPIMFPVFRITSNCK